FDINEHSPATSRRAVFQVAAIFSQSCKRRPVLALAQALVRGVSQVPIVCPGAVLNLGDAMVQSS
ncbi:hypothetical protein ACCT09_23550, partial [Rhizobium ruizarguesonis]